MPAVEGKETKPLKLAGFGAVLVYLFIFYSLLMSVFLLASLAVAEPRGLDRMFNGSDVLLWLTAGFNCVAVVFSAAALIVLFTNSPLLLVKACFVFLIAFNLFEFTEGIALAALRQSLDFFTVVENALARGVIGALVPVGFLIFINKTERKTPDERRLSL